MSMKNTQNAGIICADRAAGGPNTFPQNASQIAPRRTSRRVELTHRLHARSYMLQTC